MRIAVVGLGGVGGYIGAKLCALKKEHDIIFVARGEHLQAIKQKGLKLIDVDEEQYYFPSESVERIDRPVDIIFLCTKTYHAKETLLQLKDAIDENTLVIPVANGVNNRESLEGLTPAKIADACVYIVSHKHQAGVIKKSTNVFALILSDTLEALLSPLLEHAGLRTKFATDIHKELWKKFLFISAMGSLTSYYEMGMGSIYKEHEQEFRDVLNEILSVAQAKDIALSQKELDKAIETASKLPLDAPTSLWLDIQAGKENELETLCGYIVKRGQDYGLKTPMMQRIYEHLR